MAVCAQCGRESPEDFGFCPGCGAPLAPVEPAREVRKVVTVLFCDLTGSTALGDRTDPETLRALMNRYYDAARAVLERHGGTVEKFVGDAVMAVFGIPVATEDDALRAVRAAVELQGTVTQLGLEARIGVNTGEVVAGEGDTLITGDAVNVAARLEQAAGAGEVLLGAETLQLVRDAVQTEQVELSLKGKPGPVSAHRLLALDIAAEGVARHLDRPLVGRLRERERLRVDFADVVATRSCRVFTLIGPAGVGKSRLVADFLDHVADRTTVGRCRALSYGDGITYWPLVELLLQLGIDPDAAIRSSPADTQLATRALLEHAAESRPMVLVLDDLQWAEPPLLDLVEHVADWSRDAPIFLLCVARPELLDARPGWGGGKLNATSLLLEPLPADDAATLADGLLGELALEGEVRDRVLASAEGNPLFIEEMAALAREAGGAVTVPPTIQAVLQARLDRLSEHERVVIERGAVEGKVFHRGAVTALAPERERDGVPGQLLSLVRKELVRPDRTQIPGDDAFRFRHLLIRDTAYEALPKTIRADLHQRFADWLADHGELLELDEIVGYHLEQAARYRFELGDPDASGAALAARAAARLGTAGTAAFAREDHHAACSLLGRATELLPEGPDRRRLLPDLIDARLLARELDGLDDLAAELERGDELNRATAVALRALIEPAIGGGATFDELTERVEVARVMLEEAGDEMGVVRCDRSLAQLAWAACRAGDSLEAAVRAHERLEAMGSTAFQSELVMAIQSILVFTGRTSAEIVSQLEALYAEVHAGPLLEASLRAARARVQFVAGEIEAEEARAAISAVAELLRQTGSPIEASFASSALAVIAHLEGDQRAAEALQRRRIEEHEAAGDRVYLPNLLGVWATHLCRVGDGRAALDAVERGRELARADDLADQIQFDAAEGEAWALLGDRDRAHACLERAIAALGSTDMHLLTTEVEYIDACARRALGEVDAARSTLEGLLADAERRGFRRLAERYRRDLARLD